MSLYYNIQTKAYPRHLGDIQAVKPGYRVGDPLPEGWVEVVQTNPPVLQPLDETNTIVKAIRELLPEQINGVWTQCWAVYRAHNTIEQAAQKSIEFQQSYLQSLHQDNPGWTAPAE